MIAESRWRPWSRRSSRQSCSRMREQMTARGCCPPLRTGTLRSTAEATLGAMWWNHPNRNIWLVERAGHAGFWLEQTMPISPLFLPIHRGLISFVPPPFACNLGVPHLCGLSLFALLFYFLRFLVPETSLLEWGSLCNKQYANSL